MYKNCSWIGNQVDYLLKPQGPFSDQHEISLTLTESSQ